MSEWFKETVLKTVVAQKAIVSSNLTPSASTFIFLTVGIFQHSEPREAAISAI